MIRAAPVVQVLSPVIALFGAAMLLPLAVSHALADAATSAYDLAVATTVASGALLWMATRSNRAELKRHHGYLLVALIWRVLQLRCVQRPAEMVVHRDHAARPARAVHAARRSHAGVLAALVPPCRRRRTTLAPSALTRYPSRFKEAA